MIKLIFTIDYEIHGNGDGSPNELMVEPAWRIIKLFDKYGAKLTVFAEVAEIIKFGEYKEKFKMDDYNYEMVINQLKCFVCKDHDVQLHLHPSYINAVYENNKWKQDWSEYNLAELSYDRIQELIKTGKEFLETLLKPINKNYKCIAFRASNWSMMPSKNIVNALLDNGMLIDTSVWKNGKRKGTINFDYSSSFSEVIPWFANMNNINEKNNNSKLLEIPIYCKDKPIISFLTPIRLYRVVSAAFHKHKVTEEAPQGTGFDYRTEKVSKIAKIKSMVIKKQPWKLDFNQATSSQLIKSLKEIEAKYRDYDHDIPVVLSGHSKISVKLNNFILEPFLKFVNKNRDKYSFAKFGDVDLESFRN